MAEIGFSRQVDFRKADTELAAIIKQVQHWNKALIEDSEDILIDGVTKIKNDIIKSMQNTKRRHFAYTVKREGKEHWPSAPNNPPAIDSGDLLKSIQIDVRNMEVEIGSDITKPPYPLYLEFGTKRMTKRPWLNPAVDRGLPGITKNLINRIKRDL